MSRTIKFVAAMALAGLCVSAAHAANLKSVHFISATAQKYYGHAGVPYTSFNAEYEARNQGLDHICQVRYSLDGWRTSTIANATFDRTVGSYERWKVNLGFNGHHATVLHVFTCEDLGGTYQVYSPSNAATITSYGLRISTSVLVTNSTW